MAGVFIPDMERPKSCVACGLYTDRFTDGEGFILECALGGYEYSNCPVIELDLVTCEECIHWVDWWDCLLHDRTAEQSDFCSFAEKRKESR